VQLGSISQQSWAYKDSTLIRVEKNAMKCAQSYFFLCFTCFDFIPVEGKPHPTGRIWQKRKEKWNVQCCMFKEWTVKYLFTSIRQKVVSDLPSVS